MILLNRMNGDFSQQTSQNYNITELVDCKNKIKKLLQHNAMSPAMSQPIKVPFDQMLMLRQGTAQALGSRA